MQNLKLFAFAVLGAGLLAINITTSTGCEASAEATGGAAGSGTAGSGTAGSATAGSGGSAAGAAGEAGAAGAAGEAGAGGSGGAAMTSGAKLAEALKADAACQACLDGLAGTVKDGAGSDVTCDGATTACDADQTCQDYIASVKDAGAQGADTDPNCWTLAAAVALGGGNDVSNTFAICAAAACGDKCGGLNFADPTGCD